MLAIEVADLQKPTATPDSDPDPDSELFMRSGVPSIGIGIADAIAVEIAV